MINRRYNVGTYAKAPYSLVPEGLTLFDIGVFACKSSTQPDACRPLTLEGLLRLREQYPEGKIVVGNTEIGIEMKYGRKTYPIFIAATHVAELNSMEVSPPA